jgi:hypothetical protein
MKHDVQVGSAAFIGSVSSSVGLFLGDLEPLLRGLVSIGQVAVAIVTVWYIITKIRVLNKKKK